MAELAAGAVSSLLGILRNEAQLLRRLGHDLEFIKEEMESMNSFLEHLARTAPPSGSHDEQVRTWMKQVRDLAHDCSNCIDNYLHRGDPAIHRARGGFRRHIWWASWFVQELIAQHKAAIRLRELKERASDVGKRRLRYGVEIPGKAAAGGSTSTTLMPSSSSTSQTAATFPTAEDEEEDEDGQHQVAAGSYSYSRQQAPEFPTLDDYFFNKIVDWVVETKKGKSIESMESIKKIESMAIVTSNNASAIAHEALTKACEKFERTVWINLSAVHYKYDKLGVNRVLCYILLHVSKQDKMKKDEKSEEVGISKFRAWKHKKRTKQEKMTQIEVSVDFKIEELECKIKDMENKINVKTVEGNTTRESTEGGNNIIEKPGGSNTAKDTEGSNKKGETEGREKIEQTVVSNKTEGAVGGENKTDEPLVQTDKPLGVLLLALLSDDERMKAKDDLSSDEQAIILTTAGKLKRHMETGRNNPQISLDVTQYEGILKELFMTSDPQETQQATTATAVRATAGTLGNNQIKEIRDQIKEIVRLVKQDILEEIQSTKSRGLGEQTLGLDQVARAIEDTKNKISQVRLKIKEQMVIKGIVDKLNEYLEGDTLFIMEDENRTRGPKWEDIVNALNLLKCANKGSAVIVTTKNSQKAKEFCYPQKEPINYSLVCQYHDIVFSSKQKRVNREQDNYNSQIIHDILDQCHPNEFCMKMFTCSLYVNPNRSNKELGRLRDALQVTANSSANYVKKIFKFSYRDMPREHKTCLLYLAVFPLGEDIRRSTIIGRWLTEGLITKEDWTTAVRHAEQCFDALIDRCLVSPGDISANGEFKSCRVSVPVHGFITKIAKKQHILDARLSHLWAHHFSIFSGLRLRASDSIDMFVQNLDNYAAQLSLLKLLDLQGCQHFDKKGNYLKAICNNIPFLKYLSIRKTNVTHLPSEINNLQDLEILDIRQTNVPEKETRHILLLKLRRLLAGGTDLSPSSNGRGVPNRKEKSLCSCVWIPYKIEKMENMEVLSNVKPSPHGNELKDVRKLWQLRKLGVVISDNDKHLRNLLQAISDLKECLQSLSITILDTRSRNTSSEGPLLDKVIYNHLVCPPKLLQSVSINGCTYRVKLLSLLAKGSNELAKVSLRGTMLNQKDLKALADLPKLSCIQLRHEAYSDPKLTFNKEEFEHLKLLFVDGRNMTGIIFEEGAAFELEKIILSSSNVKSLCGVGSLPKLKGIEFKGNESFVSFLEDGGTHQENTDPVSPSKDGKASQKRTEDDLPSNNGKPPRKSTEHISPCKDGATPQKSAGPVSPAVDGVTPQKNIENVSPSEDGATQKKSDGRITFKKGEFKHLKYFHFEDSKMMNITFEYGSAPELEKIILSLMTSPKSKLTVSGSLPKLKEIELTGDRLFFLSLFQNADKIYKVSLRDTLLNKDDLRLLAKKPNLCCLMLLDNSCDGSQLTFNKGDFPKLNILIVKCSMIKNISFNEGSVPNLEKIIWSFTKLESLSGIDNVGTLKEIELDGDAVLPQVKKDIRAHKEKPVLVHKKPQHQHPKEDKKQAVAESWFQCLPKLFLEGGGSGKADQGN